MGQTLNLFSNSGLDIHETQVQYQAYLKMKCQPGSNQTGPSSRQTAQAALTSWRIFLFPIRLPVKVESSFNYLEINAINAVDHTQVVIETEKISYQLKLMSLEDLEQVVSHVTASLKKIFPDSSPGKLLKKNSPELQERIKKITLALEEQTDSNQGPCGGYSETYAALCDYNGFSFKEEIQWDVDTIYHSQNTKEFNLLDFSHLDTRDVALCVAALAFNQWFTKLFSKDLRLSPDVIEQVLYVISSSTKLEELILENAGLKFDVGQKIALALKENIHPVLHTINLSNNQLEDRGVSALSQQFEKLSKGLKYLNLSRTSLTTKGLNSLAQSLIANETCSSSLVHLDISGNPGILAAEDTCTFYNFISHPNALTYLDLAGTDCALDSLFGALNRGCCTHLISLILDRNVFSHKKTREIPPSLKQFFSNCLSLKCITLSGIKLPLEAVRAILQGLACNTHICDIHLDLSNCELRSAGAQVIQDHIIDANTISSLDLSDNGFDSDMVTLVLSIGRSKSIRHVALGKNFNIKSKALADVLHRIVQLIQDEECPLQSLSVADSRLKSGTNVIINALGSNTCLKKIDISGNAMGDTGAKMLAKALQINTSLRYVWFVLNASCASKPLNETSSSDKAGPETSKDEITINGTMDLLSSPDNELAPIERVSMLRRRTIRSRRIRPTTALNRISDIETEKQLEGTDFEAMEQLLTVSSQSVTSRPISTDMNDVNNTPTNTETTFTDSLMDLPTEGMKLKHCTKGRPRPNRIRKHPPSKPTVQSVDQEKGKNVTIGRLDLGLEEFFTKKIIQEETSYASAALSDSSSQKDQPQKLEDSNTSSLPKTKKRYPKLSDLFAFKKTRFNRMQKVEKDPERNQQKGKKNSSVDILKPQNESEEMHDQAKPEEGSAEQTKQDIKLRHQSSFRGLKTHSLILFPGSKDVEESSLQFTMKGKESKTELCEGRQLLRSEQHIHRTLERAGLKVLQSDPKTKLNAESELKGTDCNEGIPGKNKRQPAPQSLKLSALANMAKTCNADVVFILLSDKEENFEGQLSTGARNADSDHKEAAKRQEITSGDQRILLPPPRRKNLQQGNKEQSINPVPLPRKSATLQKSLIQDEVTSSEKHTSWYSTSTNKGANDWSEKENNEECLPSEDKCETNITEPFSTANLKGTEEATLILEENLSNQN
ncbi:capping protein, Arp2/3 and myosin-I linker protein 2 [Rhincodon typus]|uniref:capping protein, Arp2/3 and myosin-I linker protein 2 n=1 Tax=Rhincodon typus TaxID=259920 RepID=UPI00202FD8D3|nr:capping protein, Arp2/3 and myosin-I linker protein 2 [Rhincodon typus]